MRTRKSQLVLLMLVFSIASVALLPGCAGLFGKKRTVEVKPQPKQQDSAAERIKRLILERQKLALEAQQEGTINRLENSEIPGMKLVGEQVVKNELLDEGFVINEVPEGDMFVYKVMVEKLKMGKNGSGRPTESHYNIYFEAGVLDETTMGYARVVTLNGKETVLLSPDKLIRKAIGVECVIENLREDSRERWVNAWIDEMLRPKNVELDPGNPDSEEQLFKLIRLVKKNGVARTPVQPKLIRGKHLISASTFRLSDYFMENGGGVRVENNKIIIPDISSIASVEKLLLFDLPKEEPEPETEEEQAEEED